MGESSSRLNHTSYRKFYFIDFVQNFLRCNFGTFNSKFGSSQSAISQILHPRPNVLISSLEYILRYIINPTFVSAVSIQKQNVKNSKKVFVDFIQDGRWVWNVIQVHFFIKSYKVWLKESWYWGLISNLSSDAEIYQMTSDTPFLFYTSHFYLFPGKVGDR